MAPAEEEEDLDQEAMAAEWEAAMGGDDEGDGGEGDDLIDEGAESAEYVVKGEMDCETYRKVLEMFRSGQPYIHDPFEERDVKVVFSKLHYDGESEEFKFELIEDIR